MVYNTRDSVTTIQHTALDTEKLLSHLYIFKNGSKMNVHTGKDEFCNRERGPFYFKEKLSFNLSGLTFVLEQIPDQKTKCSQTI